MDVQVLGPGEEAEDSQLGRPLSQRSRPRIPSSSTRHFQVVGRSMAVTLASMSDVTRLLDAAASGDHQAAADLLPAVYDELRKLAAAHLANEPSGQSLQPTALVHEAYLRLVGGANATAWTHRGHFFAAASVAIRRILIDNARRKGRRKHGGEFLRVDLEATAPALPEPAEDLLALDDALTKLAEVHPREAEVVQLLYFGGLTLPEAARTLGVSPRTAGRLWRFSRAWLRREIEPSDDSGGNLG